MSFPRPIHLLVIAAVALFARLLFRRRPHEQPSTLPPDVYPDSRNRLPQITREELDGLGQELYDEIVGDSRSFAGLIGPGGIRLRAPACARVMRPASLYLRFEAGLDPRLAEVAVLATARENDQDFEWNA